MRDKLSLLKALDIKIYAHFIKQWEDVLFKGKQLNNGKVYQYKNFDLTASGFYYTPRPNQLCKDYLEEQLTEMAPVMNERAIVNAYLLRYTNQIAGWKYPTVLYLLPESLRTYYSADIEDMVDTHVLEKIEEFRAMPEHQLIKKRLFIGGLLA